MASGSRHRSQRLASLEPLGGRLPGQGHDPLTLSANLVPEVRAAVTKTQQM